MKQTTDKKQAPKPSKWAKVVQRIEKLNIPSDIGKHIRKSSREFRDNFHFKHDLVEDDTRRS